MAVTYLRFRYNCVAPLSVSELNYIIDNSTEITFETFSKYVSKQDFKQLQLNLGYSRGFHIKNDWSVSYHKSELPDGRAVYFFAHSCIEYIFY